MHAAALRYLDAVARLGSIRRAASELNISASAINRQILQLEQSLGVELFERRASGMKTTEFGDLVVEHVRRTLHDFEAVKTDISHAKNRLSGLVRIATLDSLTVNVLPRAIIGFRQTFPNVTFSLKTGDPARVTRLVGNDSADLGLTFESHTHTGIDVRHRVPAPLCAIMSSNHPLAVRDVVSVADCAGYDMIVQEDTGPVVEFMGQEIVAMKQTAAPILISDTIIASKSHILHGNCIGFFTRFGFLEELAAEKVVAIPLTETAPSSISLATIVSSTRRTSRAVEAFMVQLGEILDTEASQAAS